MIDSLAEKRRALALMKRRDDLRAANGILYYKPHAKQDLFHRAGNYKGRYARTGNRFGKSEMGAAEDVAWLLGERPWYPEGDPARYTGIPQHPVKLLLLVTDWPKSTEIFTSLEQGERRGKLFSLIPKASLVGTPHRNHGGNIDIIRVKSKWGGTSLLYIDTMQAFKQNPMGAESSDWDAIHVDEPVSHKFWRAVSRGLIDRDGKYWFTCTPLTEMWINDLFIPSERMRDTFDEPFINDNKFLLTGSIFDNPHISKAAAEEFLSGSLSEAERECREKGIPTSLSGIIFKQFDPIIGGKHLKDFREFKNWENGLPPKDHSIYIAIDPHPKTPHAVLFCAVSPLGQKFVYREIFRPGLIESLCKSMGAILEGHKPQRCVCDPIAWVENQVTGVVMADQFADHGFYVEPASKELDYGILKAQEALEEDDSWYFDVGLRQTRYEFDHYTWHPDKEKPIDEDDHMMECFRRLVMTKPTWVDPTGRHLKPIPSLDLRNAPRDFGNVREAMDFARGTSDLVRTGYGVDDDGIPYTEIWGANRDRYGY